MCAPFRQTHVHTHHTATVGPDLHPTMLASAGEGAGGVARLGSGPTPRGSSFVPLMLKNQSRMDHHKESSWGEERKGKRMGMGMGGRRKGKEKGWKQKREKKKVWGMMGTQGDTEVRGWVLSTEEPPGQAFGVQGITLSTPPTIRLLPRNSSQVNP